MIFFGSAELSNVVLQYLIDAGTKVDLVVTKPDRPVGRGLKMAPNPVKVLAEKYKIQVIHDLRFMNHESKFLNQIGLVAAYGKIIKPEVLSMFNGQLFNIHPSLLPKYRGASPLQSQILVGETTTGVTIIKLDDQMDHGPIVAQEKDNILPDDTWISLGERLFKKGAELFMKIHDSGFKIQELNQNHSAATYTKMLTRQDGFLSWEVFQAYIMNRESKIDNLFRAYAGWPGVWTINPESNKRIKLIKLNPLTIQEEGKAPGQI